MCIEIPKGEYSASNNLPWYAPKLMTRCNQSSNYAKTPKVNTALQLVFFGTYLNGRRAAISLPPMLKP